jgi:hypothetical protein
VQHVVDRNDPFIGKVRCETIEVEPGSGVCVIAVDPEKSQWPVPRLRQFVRKGLVKSDAIGDAVRGKVTPEIVERRRLAAEVRICLLRRRHRIHRVHDRV